MVELSQVSFRLYAISEKYVVTNLTSLCLKRPEMQNGLFMDDYAGFRISPHNWMCFVR